MVASTAVGVATIHHQQQHAHNVNVNNNGSSVTVNVCNSESNYRSLGIGTDIEGGGEEVVSNLDESSYMNSSNTTNIGSNGTGRVTNNNNFSTPFPMSVNSLNASTLFANDYHSAFMANTNYGAAAQVTTTTGVLPPSTAMLTNYCDAAMMMAAAAVNANQCLQQHQQRFALMAENSLESNETSDQKVGTALSSASSSTSNNSTSTASLLSSISTSIASAAAAAAVAISSTSANDGELKRERQCHVDEGASELPQNLIDISEVPLIVDVK